MLLNSIQKVNIVKIDYKNMIFQTELINSDKPFRQPKQSKICLQKSNPCSHTFKLSMMINELTYLHDFKVFKYLLSWLKRAMCPRILTFG